jgi:hypothetical protein
MRRRATSAALRFSAPSFWMRATSSSVEIFSLVRVLQRLDVDVHRS